MSPILEGIWHGVLLGLGAWLLLGWAVTRARRARLPAPEPPVNVRVVLDGREVPVECVYIGAEPGPGGLPLYHWHVVTDLAAASMPEAIAYDVLPARTVVSVAVRHDPEAGP